MNTRELLHSKLFARGISLKALSERLNVSERGLQQELYDIDNMKLSRLDEILKEINYRISITEFVKME